MIAAIDSEISDAMKLTGIATEGARATLEDVRIDRDETGGKNLYVILTMNDTSHRICITKRHLHSIREVGKIAKQDFIDLVESALDDFNLSDTVCQLAVKRCLKLMREEKLIKR